MPLCSQPKILHCSVFQEQYRILMYLFLFTHIQILEKKIDFVSENIQTFGCKIQHNYN